MLNKNTILNNIYITRKWTQPDIHVEGKNKYKQWDILTKNFRVYGFRVAYIYIYLHIWRKKKLKKWEKYLCRNRPVDRELEEKEDYRSKSTHSRAQLPESSPSRERERDKIRYRCIYTWEREKQSVRERGDRWWTVTTAETRPEALERAELDGERERESS
jgi:hypothetical protein